VVDRSWEGVEIDSTVAHASRMYDYMLGGTTNFAVDRDACIEANRDFPGGIEAAKAGIRANRDFLGRAVRYMANAGVRQFLDLGTGIPSDDNTHAIALSIAPDSRIVYVDNDPIVLAHAHQLLANTSQSTTSYRFTDMRDVDTVVSQAAETLDFTKPVGLVLVAILHFVTDDEDPYGLVAKLVEAVPSGSYLAISHLASDIMAEEMEALYNRISERTKETFVLRSRSEVARFFDGVELVDPGIALVSDWHIESPGQIDLPVYAGVGVKP
jgi:trans-aconitate methyltransferase